MKFRMVDRITHCSPLQRICGVKTVSFEEYRLKSAFGDQPQLPETLVMESLFQLGNWLIMLSSDFSQMGLIIRFERAEFAGILRPGCYLEMQADVRSYREDGIVFDGQAMVDSQVIASGCGCLATLVPLGDYFNPDDMRILFSELYKPSKPTAEVEL